MLKKNGNNKDKGVETDKLSGSDYWQIGINFYLFVFFMD